MNIAVIGAGLSGLTCANILSQHHQVTVFEKARGVSGRLSTRRSEDLRFDHGAQFIRARSDVFMAFIDELVDQQIISSWDARFKEINHGISSEVKSFKQDNYVGIPGMNQIGKFLAKTLDVSIDTRIKEVNYKDKTHILTTENGDVFEHFDQVIFAIPSDQLIDLLPANVSFANEIPDFKMRACATLMISDPNLPDFGFDACQITGHDLSWLSVNNSKPKRGNYPCIVIHSSHDWADQHAFDDRDWMKSHLLSEAKDLFDYDFSSSKHSNIHVWLYSNIAKVNDAVYYRDEKMNISACGDWCLRGNVESAYLSGYELAHALLENS